MITLAFCVGAAGVYTAIIGTDCTLVNFGTSDAISMEATFTFTSETAFAVWTVGVYTADIVSSLALVDIGTGMTVSLESWIML